MADAKTLIEQGWAEGLQTTKPGTWFAKHRNTSGHWQNFFSLLSQAAAISSSTAAHYITQARAEFLLTIQAGTWYAANPGSTGHWLNGRNLLNKAEAVVVPTSSVFINGQKTIGSVLTAVVS